MSKSTNAMRFDEDNFDLSDHKKRADAVVREKARTKRLTRQVRTGKIILAIVSIIIFFILFYIAVQLGFMA
ncbi:MAG: hypothetical protein FWG87_09215 [Defluviitaleaceae bacterium]|nr:hypothetical protein [Defluviitaleaceae bacterium]